MNGKDLSKDFIWNTLGSLSYALSSMLLAMAVIALAGAEEGGIFSFGFSTLGQQMFIIAYFGIRPFHITDVENSYSFGEYRRLRIITSAAAALCAAVYMLFMSFTGSYTARKAVIVFIVALYKIADGAADVYECECQRCGKLYIGGMELFIRTVLSASSIIIGLLVFKNLMAAAVSGVIMQAVVILVFRHCTENRLFEVGKTDGNAVKGLFVNTVLLFVSVFLDFYIFSSAKYAVDAQLGNEANSVFTILFMPANIIYLAANFVIKPLMTRLADAYAKRDRQQFSRYCIVMEGLIAGLTAAAMLAVLIIGTPVLTIMEMLMGGRLGGALIAVKNELYLILLGGGIYALSSLQYYILVILRRQKLIFAVYLVGAAAAFAAAGKAVAAYGMAGGPAVFCALMLFVYLCFRLISGRILKKEMPRK